MNPDDTLERLDAALYDGDLTTARDAFAALNHWLESGGELPSAWADVIAQPTA